MPKIVTHGSRFGAVLFLDVIPIVCVGYWTGVFGDQPFAYLEADWNTLWVLQSTVRAFAVCVLQLQIEHKRAVYRISDNRAEIPDLA